MRVALRSFRVIPLALLVAGALCAQPVAGAIMFTSDTAGFKPNGFQSVDSSQVSFTDSIGADMEVDDFFSQSHGNALAVNGDDASKLLMTFSTPINALSMAFGNDDPGVMIAGDVAVLQAFVGATLVGSTTVTANRNDDMDQIIALSGIGAFDNAVFYYGRGPGTPTPIALIEVVDDINFTSVPEPACMSAVAAAMGLTLLRRRIRPC